MNSFESKPPLVVGFGGGGSTGATTAGFLDAVESGLVPGVDTVEAFALVGTADDGSTTGRLRNMYGTPAVGDLRRSISALSTNRDAAADFERRFDASTTVETVAACIDQLVATLTYTTTPDQMATDTVATITDSVITLGKDILSRDPERALQGVALGHLVLTALSVEHGIDAAAQLSNTLMQTRAEVIPVSTKPHFLKMRDGDETRFGEHVIDTTPINHPDDVEVSLYTEPDGSSTGVRLNPRVKDAIDHADRVIIGPGSVYTSILPALLPEGMQDALQLMRSEGRPLTLVGNLVTQDTETAGWSGDRYVTETERYIGRKYDDIVYNRAVDGLENPVIFDRESLEKLGPYRIIATKLVGPDHKTFDPNDPLAGQRSALSHDMGAVAMSLLTSHLEQLEYLTQAA